MVVLNQRCESCLVRPPFKPLCVDSKKFLCTYLCIKEHLVSLNLSFPFFNTHPPVLLQLKAAKAELKACYACPRACGVDRTKHLDGKYAVCGVGSVAKVSAVFPHFGEEPCLQV